MIKFDEKKSTRCFNATKSKTYTHFWQDNPPFIEQVKYLIYVKKRIYLEKFGINAEHGDSGKSRFLEIIFRVKHAFGNSGKMRSGNVRSGKRRSTL